MTRSLAHSPPVSTREFLVADRARSTPQLARDDAWNLRVLCRLRYRSHETRRLEKIGRDAALVAFRRRRGLFGIDD